MKKVLILLTLILNLTIAENYSLNFEGCDWCDDYVDFGDNLDMGDNSFSYAMWVKMNSVNVDWQQNILSKGITGGGNPSETGYKLSMLPGQNRIKATISSGLDESEGAINIYTEPVEVGDWNHVCVVVDRQTETMKIFLNGVIQDTGDISSISNINNNGHLHLGNQYWPDTGQNAAVLDGKIYLFSMWNSALSNSKVLSVSRNEFDSSDEDLIGLWQFSEGSGNYLLDSVGVNNGQIFGATWNNNYPILGCIDQLAKNYNEEAEVDDGSCSYIIDIASDTTNFTYGGTYDGKYYYISNYETNFDTALAISASYDGYLTVISSSEENSFVVDMLSSHVEYYAHLGYYIRDNGWQWVEGESSEYTNWYATQPDDSGYQNAAIYVHNLNGRYGQWHDSNSDYYFVIESNVVPNEFSGCTDELAENYSVEAEVDNGSCILMNRLL